MPMKISQKERILRHLKDFGSITPMEAIREYGITRLADVIFRLKKDGFLFKTEIKDGFNRYKEKTSFAKYTLVGQKVLN